MHKTGLLKTCPRCHDNGEVFADFDGWTVVWRRRGHPDRRSVALSNREISDPMFGCGACPDTARRTKGGRRARAR